MNLIILKKIVSIIFGLQWAIALYSTTIYNVLTLAYIVCVNIYYVDWVLRGYTFIQAFPSTALHCLNALFMTSFSWFSYTGARQTDLIIFRPNYVMPLFVAIV